MSPLEVQEERQTLKEEYEALKKLLGGILLEQTESDPAIIAYFNRKFTEARQSLRS